MATVARRSAAGARKWASARFSPPAMPPVEGEVPRRAFGTTGEYVSAMGLGGYHLGLVGTEREAARIVHEAIDAGITFMDNAWEYHEGKSEERMGKALAGRRDRGFLMTKCCRQGREAREAV